MDVGGQGAAGDSRVTSFGFLSSAPPTPCGLATFSAALGSSLAQQGSRVGIVRVLDAPEGPSTSPVPVIADMVAGDRTSIERAVGALNECDVAFVQHEYGLYGGPDGSDVLQVISGLAVPVVVTLHTILSKPTPHQRRVLNRVIDRADAVVVMTDRAETILRATNDVGDPPVAVIPHGAAVSPPSPRAPHERPVVLTWGLIGPGKGIQWVIDALVDLRDVEPAPLYVIAGQTHPKVLAHEGDAYRESLVRRVAENSVGHMVRFDNSYRELAALNELIASADVVVLPYDSRDQATSGVLVDAVAAGRPVIATAFPHAIELLGSGAGIVVEQGDVPALSDAIRRVVTDADAAAQMSAEAAKIAPGLSWDAVGRQYHALAGRLLHRAKVVA
ncbi:MAG: glycosyltransferase [Acidobacteriota bacterium]|nr:glycosyltransferase [Acidobacteriota bacterium]